MSDISFDSPSPPPEPPAPPPPEAYTPTVQELASRRAAITRRQVDRSDLIVDPATSTGPRGTGTGIRIG